MAKFQKTPYGQLAQRLAPVIRNLQDMTINKLTGSKTALLRIKQDTIDLLGDETYSLQDHIIANCIVEYPFSDIEIFAVKDSQSSLNVNSVSIFDLLPVKIVVPFDGTTLLYKEDSSNLDENDLLVDCLEDHNGNKIPIIMQAPVIRGTFLEKHIIQKTYNATLFRGTLEASIQTIVTRYINNWDKW